MKKMADGDGTQAKLEMYFPKEYKKIDSLPGRPGDEKSRCAQWQKYAGAPVYDTFKWRKEARIGDVRWDDMSQGSRKSHVKGIGGKEDFDFTTWAYFHRGAHLQRSQVLSRLN